LGPLKNLTRLDSNIFTFPDKAIKPPRLGLMDPEKDWKEELDSFEARLKARKAAEKYAPWHPRNMILHPTRTWRLAFGIVGDSEMEFCLAHMDSGTAGSKDKPRPKPKQN
jgi:hypothetical protein